MNSQKRLLLTLKYLWEKTDEEHPVTLKEIGEYLQQNGIETTRKTLQADINLLTGFGIDIICNHSTQNQYHIGERVFEVPEIKLLVDAVQSARFITAKKSKTLIKKLSLFVGEPQADILKRQLYVDHRLKAGNEGIYFTVDLIHQAIRLKKRVTFQYYYYTPNKKKELKHNGKVYVFSPFALIWNDDSYYVIGYSDSHQKIVKFRNPAIVSRETYQAAQELQKSKSKGCFVKKDRYPLSTMLKCPVCGHNYRRQIVNGKAYWVCSYKASGRLECTSERISEEAAKEAFVRMTDKLIRNREDLLGDLIRQLEKMQSRVSGNHEKVYQIDCRIADINAQNLVVAQLHNKGILNNAEFTAQSGELSRKVSELRSERRRILMEDEDDELIDTLHTLDETLAEYIPANTFDEDLFEQIVESITVISGQKLSFRLAGGLVLTEKI